MTVPRTWVDRLLPFAGLASGILVWWLATRRGGMLVASFSPGETFRAFGALFASGAIWPHFAASLRRIAEGLALAALLGIPLGILLGIAPRLDRFTSLPFQFVRMISPLAWMPIAVMVLGIGDAPVLFLLVVAAVWPILLGTLAGVHAVDRESLLLARSLCATQREIVLKVILPSIIPHLLTGLRLAMGVAWIVLVPAEMLGVRAGLGYYILDTRDRLAYSELTAMVLIIGLLGFLLDAAARGLYRLATHGRG